MTKQRQNKRRDLPPIRHKIAINTPLQSAINHWDRPLSCMWRCGVCICAHWCVKNFKVDETNCLNTHISTHEPTNFTQIIKSLGSLNKTWRDNRVTEWNCVHSFTMNFSFLMSSSALIIIKFLWPEKDTSSLSSVWQNTYCPFSFYELYDCHEYSEISGCFVHPLLKSHWLVSFYY